MRRLGRSASETGRPFAVRIDSDSSESVNFCLCVFGGVFSIRFRTSSRAFGFLAMSIFDELDPSLRAQALVGYFLQVFALMESGINDAIGKALGLSPLQTIIVAKNVQFSSKIHILRTALPYTSLSESERIEFHKTLGTILNYAPTRNMVAHDLFSPAKGIKGVNFHVTKAKGKLDFPETIWDIEKFQAEAKQLLIWSGEIERLKSAITEKEKAQGLLANALLRWSSLPSYGLSGQAPEGLPSLLPQGLLGSLPPAATPQIDGETPLEPEE